MLVTVVAELAVHLVGKEIEVIFLDQSGNLEELLVGVEVTCGVVGVANHNGLGTRGDDLFEFFDWRQGKACLDVAGDGDNLGVAQLGEGVVVGIVRLRDDDFVARIEADGEGHLKSLATTCGDDYLVGGHVDTVAVIVVAEGTSVTRDAGRVAIFENAMAYR